MIGESISKDDDEEKQPLRVSIADAVECSKGGSFDKSPVAHIPREHAETTGE